MPYKITWEQEGLLVQFTGTVTRSDLTNVNPDVYADPRARRIKYVILDFRSAGQIGFTISEVKRNAEIDALASRALAGVKMAIISEDDVIKGWAKLYDLASKKMTGKSEFLIQLRPPAFGSSGPEGNRPLTQIRDSSLTPERCSSKARLYP